MTEFLYCFVAVCDLPDDIAQTGGLVEEAEDIRGHLMSLDDLLKLVNSGEGANGPLVVTAQWLALNRDALRP